MFYKIRIQYENQRSKVKEDKQRTRSHNLRSEDDKRKAVRV